MLKAILVLNFFLYSVGAWAQKDPQWLMPLEQWEGTIGIYFLIIVNAIVPVFMLVISSLGVPLNSLLVISSILLLCVS